MAPKGGKGGGAKSKPKEEQREDTLQAVVLADSFEKRFPPFSDEKPRCLLPLANTPLIEYTLDFLAHAGVEEIFIYCGNHTDQLEAYIESSRWEPEQPSSPFTSLILVQSPATSVGEAMRDLDNRGLITGNFLLVIGDVVSNLSIESALAQHRARREKDKNAIMTMILREVGRKHRIKPKSKRPVFFIDESTNRCVHYEEIDRKREGKHHMELDADILKKHPEIDIRGDLLDPSIDICAPDVLSLWSDNFDYQSMRTSFLFGVLKDWELNGKTIHTHIETQGYAARVRSLRTYDAITQDIIDRYTYPITPDCNLFPDQTYTLGRNKVYSEKGVILARGSSINKRSIVGAGTSLGDGSSVTNSVIGRRCQIGRNVTIRGSYIWDDVVIGDNTTVEKTVIASEASISKSCTLPLGTLISFGTQVAASTKLEPSTIVTRSGTTLRGSSVKGPETTSDDYGSESDVSVPSAHLLTLSPTPSFVSVDSISTLYSESEPDMDDLSLNSQGVSDDEMLPTATRTIQQKDFFAEAAASIYDGLITSEDADKIRLELVAQRLSSNAADSQVRDALVEGFMRRIWTLVDGTSAVPTSDTENEDAAEAPKVAEKVSPGTAVKSIFAPENYGFLLKQMGIFDYAKPEGQKVDQVAILKGVEEKCKGKDKGNTVLLFVVKECVDGELVQEEGVFEWWDEGGEETEDVRGLTKQYVELLRQEEESSEEEESEEESDEE